MLKLSKIKKVYSENSDNEVTALKAISLTFRECEFVSILGQSGCGKTTLLNIIGGLDRYTSGDLIIDGVSTKEYKSSDWDTYRNHSIGFVFQSYNLIPHLTVLENVELALTIGGLSKSERRERAKDALVSVGLESKLNKKPNQLSGGQMQRVSIARAIVNEPSIILADEPTGALDSDTSKTVIDLLKEISKTRLVIMVTHNPDLALKYSDRVIRMLDGLIIDDSNPYNEDSTPLTPSPEQNLDKKTINYKKKKSSMSFSTAFKLSGKNILSKKKRTIITSLAASIGIMGIAVILSLSNGMQKYIDDTMLDSAAFNYVMINAETSPMTGTAGGNVINQNQQLVEYPEHTTGVIPYEQVQFEPRKQKLSSEFISYLESKTKNMVIDITYSYNVNLNILTNNNENLMAVSSSNWHEAMNNTDYLKDRYTVLASNPGLDSGIPEKVEEVSLLVDRYNRLPTSMLDALGISYQDDLSVIDYNQLLNKEFRIAYNDAWYTPVTTAGTTIYRSANVTDYQRAYDDENGVTVKIVSILRENPDSTASWLSNGIVYTPALTQAVLEHNKTSAVALAQVNNTKIDVTTGELFTIGSIGGIGGFLGVSTYEDALEKLGYTQTPTSIMIYPTDIENREAILNVLSEWNTQKAGTDEIIEYFDMSSTITSVLGTVVDVITYVLMFFSITSLVISSIMIAIIIYASVIERTKEIGVLRSLGARKKDVGRIFEAEAIIIGLISGVIAIIVTIIINVIINAILNNLLGITNIANLSIFTAIGLIILSAGLLLIASLVPARLASKKEPAVALRTE